MSENRGIPLDCYGLQWRIVAPSAAGEPLTSMQRQNIMLAFMESARLANITLLRTSSEGYPRYTTVTADTPVHAFPHTATPTSLLLAGKQAFESVRMWMGCELTAMEVSADWSPALYTDSDCRHGFLGLVGVTSYENENNVRVRTVHDVNRFPDGSSSWIVSIHYPVHVIGKKKLEVAGHEWWVLERRKVMGADGSLMKNDTHLKMKFSDSSRGLHPSVERELDMLWNGYAEAAGLRKDSDGLLEIHPFHAKDFTIHLLKKLYDSDPRLLQLDMPAALYNLVKQEEMREHGVNPLEKPVEETYEYAGGARTK